MKKRQPDTLAIPITCENLYLSDIDGVLTDSRSDYQGADREALQTLLEASASGELALATGRPFGWVKRNILETGQIPEARKSKLVIASENGAVLSHYQDSEWKSSANDTVTVPAQVRSAFETIADQHEDCMEYDKEKVAMATLVELSCSRTAKEKFQRLKDGLTEELKEKFKDLTQVRISNTEIAIDACHVQATKALAAHELLLQMGGGKRVHIFGDSASDSDLATHAAQVLQESEVTFNYLSSRELDATLVNDLKQHGVNISCSKALFSKGLIELLDTHKG